MERRRPISKCTACGGSRLADSSETEEHEVSGTKYRIEVPAWKCRRCGEVFVDGPATLRAELVVAGELARHGPANGETFRFMRSSLQLRATELADLLDIRAETVSRWEKGHDPVDRSAWAALAAMVCESLEKRRDTRDRLEAIRSPAQKPRTIVRLDLDP